MRTKLPARRRGCLDDRAQEGFQSDDFAGSLVAVPPRGAPAAGRAGPFVDSCGSRARRSSACGGESSCTAAACATPLAPAASASAPPPPDPLGPAAESPSHAVSAAFSGHVATANGVTVWLLERTRLPSFRSDMTKVHTSGASSDPSGRAGVRLLAANMLENGRAS